MVAFLLFPLVVAGVLWAGLLFQRQGARRDARRFPPPGRFVHTAAGTFHVHQTSGSAGPAVILESGLAGSSLSWALVQEEVSRFAHVCSYDRAGFGWSSPIRSARSVDAVVTELRDLLEGSGLPRPFVLVGHSYGGLIVRAFAHIHPDLTAGMVLIDPVSTGHWAECGQQDRLRLARGIRLSSRGALLARFGFVRFVLGLVMVGRNLLPQAVARMTAPGAVPFLQRLTREIQKLPAPLWPIVRAQWSRPMGFAAISAYLSVLQENCKVAEANRYQSSAPTVILSASTATDFELHERAGWLEESRDGEHRLIPDSGHWIQVERPVAVIEAIRAVIEKARQTGVSSSNMERE